MTHTDGPAGVIPVSIAGLSSLQTLNLGSNDLSGMLVSILCMFKQTQPMMRETGERDSEPV